MLNDKFGNPVYQEKDIIDLIYKDIDISNIVVEHSENIEKLEENSGLQLKKFNAIVESLSIKEFDEICQQDWFVPDEYKNLDIEELLVKLCPDNHYQRLIDELREYRARNLLPLLKVLKYLVDTFRKHDILWGVGRGSSVSSYVLYLLEVHRIDSIKYQLDWQDFLR